MRCFGLVILVLLLLVAIFVGMAGWGYSSLQFELSDVSGIQPEFKMDFQTVVGAAAHLLLSDWVGAASQFVEGVAIEGTMRIQNHSFMPLFICALEHGLSVNGNPLGDSSLKTPSMWLGPKGTKSVPVEIMVPLEEMPDILVECVYSGGNLNIDLHSTLRLGTFTFGKTSTVTTHVTDAIASSPTSSVDSYGFSPTAASVGDTVSASVTISGGDPGQYTVRYWKDISLSPDQQVGEFSFYHDGSTTMATNPFSPSASSTYHMDLVFGSEQLWSQPNDASRVTFTSSAATFSMNSYGFSPTAASVGDTVTAGVTISGGDPGQYTVRFWKDISLSPDQQIGQFSFDHDGSTTTATNPFSPLGSGTYHMDLVFGSEQLWSQPNDASRVTFTSSAATFSMNSYGFSPAAASVGDTVTAGVVVSGGDPGEYTVRFWKDITLWPDEQVGEFSFYHDGSTTTGTTSFCPAVAGTYHMNLVYGGQQLWSQPNDVSRVTFSD